MKLNRCAIGIVFIGLLWGLVSCQKKYTPKPKSYFRIDLPAKKYKKWDTNYPFSFELANDAKIIKDKDKNAEKYWLNINYPGHKANIHLSYKDVKGNLEQYLEDSRKLAYKHSIKADAIGEQSYLNDSKKVYALIYRIKGNAASSVQFVATDSVHHFLRGALYFKVHPNQDSLAPVIQYIDKDIVHIIETLEWK